MIKPKLSEICQVVGDDLERVEERLVSHTSGRVDRASRLADGDSLFIDKLVYHVIEGGKKIRPLLLLLSAKSAGDYDCEIASDFATVVELIHVASLLHDDVIDNGEIRRGKESVNSKWGIKTAILLGDFLNAKVLEILNCHSHQYIMSIVSDTVQAMCEGEMLHTYRNENLGLSDSDYIEIVTMKTGELMAASCLIGAHIAQSMNLDAYRKYGINLGIAFQLTDDLLDLQGKKELLGKAPFNDLREGKLSYPYICLKERCSENEFAEMRKIMMSSSVDDKIDWIIDLMEKYEVKKECKSLAKEYANEAKSALEFLPDSDAQIALKKLADYAILRKK